MLGDERRKFPRADLVFQIKYSADSVVPTRAISRDLSGGGISFESAEIFATGAAIKIEFSLQGLTGEIQARGRVVRSWAEQGRNFTALEFTEIDEQDKVIVTDYSLSHSDEVI